MNLMCSLAEEPGTWCTWSLIWIIIILLPQTLLHLELQSRVCISSVYKVCVKSEPAPLGMTSEVMKQQVKGHSRKCCAMSLTSKQSDSQTLDMAVLKYFNTPPSKILMLSFLQTWDLIFSCVLCSVAELTTSNINILKLTSLPFSV